MTHIIAIWIWVSCVLSYFLSDDCCQCVYMQPTCTAATSCLDNSMWLGAELLPGLRRALLHVYTCLYVCEGEPPNEVQANRHPLHKHTGVLLRMALLL